MSMKLIREVCNLRKVPANEKMVLVSLANHSSSDGAGSISLMCLASVSGIRVRGIKDVLAHLCEKQFLAFPNLELARLVGDYTYQLNIRVITLQNTLNLSNKKLLVKLNNEGSPIHSFGRPMLKELA